MSARTPGKADGKRDPERVLLEIAPRSAVDRLEGVDSDAVIERGERRWFTKAEAEALLLLEFEGERVLQTAGSED